MNLTEDIYRNTKNFPSEEKFGLVSQMNRAVVSIPSNVAEGHGRNSTGEYIQHLGIAKGSLCELETQIEISKRLGFLSIQTAFDLLEKCAVVNKLLVGLIKSLKNR